MTSPLTAAEWLSENSERQELAVMNIPLAMELYARYKADIECVEFAEWALQSSYVMEFGGWTNIHRKDGIITTAQLRTIYKQSKTK